MFNKTGKEFADCFSFTVNAEHSGVKMLLTDLKPGSWVVYKNGSKYKSLRVKADEKCAYLTLDSGEYKLEKLAK